jgi:adenine-specific DNA-methyltransferase
VKDGKAEEVTRQPEQVKAFRDTWEKGIHSYLAYLRDRLLVAQELLTETGSIFVQIGDENVHLVRCLLDEVFGSENFISMLSFAKTSGLEAVSRVASRVDFLLWYAKDSKQIKYRELFTEKSLDSVSGYTHVELPDGLRRRLTSEEVDNLALLPRGSRVFTPDNLTKPGPGSRFQVRFEGRSFEPGNRWWGTTPESMDKLIEQNRLIVIGNSLRYVRYLDDFSYAGISNLWLDTGIAGFKADKRYVVETNPKVIERCLLMTTDPGDLVLDTTGGSGSTAYVAEQWGRRWISIDTSRVALALARTRLMSAKYPYYLLADSPEGIQKEAEITGQLLQHSFRLSMTSGKALFTSAFPLHTKSDRQQP